MSVGLKKQLLHGYSGPRAGGQLVRDVTTTVSPSLFGAIESSGMKKLELVLEIFGPVALGFLLFLVLELFLFETLFVGTGPFAPFCDGYPRSSAASVTIGSATALPLA